MDEKVRPKGWGFLMAFAIAVDALQFIFNLFGFVSIISVVGITLSVFLFLLNVALSIFIRVTIWIWQSHNDLPSNFGHTLIPTIVEMIPFFNWIPFWSIYAFTYWVEEDDQTYSFSNSPLPPGFSGTL
jgi:hypothetical protein